MKKRHYNKIANVSVYFDELERDGGFPPLPNFYETGSYAWYEFRKENFADYKNFNLVVGPDGNSVEIVRYVSEG